MRLDDGWWLVRASNTEAALVARAEGKTPEILRRLVKDIESALSNAGLKWTGQNRAEQNSLNDHDNK